MLLKPRLRMRRWGKQGWRSLISFKIDGLQLRSIWSQTYAILSKSLAARDPFGLTSFAVPADYNHSWLFKFSRTKLDLQFLVRHERYNYNPPQKPSRFYQAEVQIVNNAQELQQYPIKLNKVMNSEDSSLLGFLKKKTLFKQSPVRHAGKRSRSKSRDSIIRKVTDREHFDQPSFKLNHTNSERHFKLNQAPNHFQKEFEPTLERGSRLGEFQNHLAKSKNPEEKFDFSTMERGNKFMTGLVNYATSFEAARVQSAQCLESLSLKLNTEVSNINFRIDQFRSNMSKVLNQELKALREEIFRLVEEAFKESERNVREYMKAEEQRLASDLIKMRETLEKEYVRVETMREEIGKPQWRKVTGEILATELEKNLEDLVKKSTATEIGRWEMKNMSGQRMKNLEMELKALVRLKE